MSIQFLEFSAILIKNIFTHTRREEIINMTNEGFGCMHVSCCISIIWLHRCFELCALRMLTCH